MWSGMALRTLVSSRLRAEPVPGERNRFTEQWDAVDPLDPAYPHLWIKVEHLARYYFARNILRSRNAASTVDLGCGTGYGSRILAEVADTVFAIDENERAIDKLESMAHDRISAVQARIGWDPLGDVIEPESLDAVVCFETLEHLLDPASALTEIAQILRHDGTLILSVPNSVAERVDHSGLLTNPFHQRAFTISSIRELIERSGFRVRGILGQPLAAMIHQNETRLIRRKQVDGRVGDEPALHDPTVLERLGLTIGYPEQRDIERSYSIIVVAERGGKDLPDDDRKLRGADTMSEQSWTM